LGRSGGIGRHGLAAGIAAVVFGISLAACTANSPHGTPIAPNVMMSEVQVVFDPRPMPVADKSAFLPNRKAVEASRKFQQVLIEGFGDRFPELAAKYGLTVTAGSPYLLNFKVVAQSTECRLSCWTRVTLAAVLFDLSASRKQLWRFDTRVGEAVGADSIPERTFDLLADEILQAMKKDGLIGR
jgi:hypothetical protein